MLLEHGNAVLILLVMGMLCHEILPIIKARLFPCFIHKHEQIDDVCVAQTRNES